MPKTENVTKSAKKASKSRKSRMSRKSRKSRKSRMSRKSQATENGTTTKIHKSKKGTKGGDSNEVSKPNYRVVMSYQLSDLENLKNGITAIPDEALQDKIITFRAAPSNPAISCFRERLVEEKVYYKPNIIAAIFNANGTGIVKYPSGDVAIEIEEERIGKKLVVYSESKKDFLGNLQESVPLAIFDDFGNGAVFDVDGNIRLNYDQGEGVLYDTPSKLPFHWAWTNSQFIMKRRKDLEFIEEDEPDNEVPDTPTQEEIEEMKAGKVKKEKKGTKGRTSKSVGGTRKSIGGTKKTKDEIRKSKGGTRKSKGGTKKNKDEIRKSKGGTRKSKSEGKKNETKGSKSATKNGGTKGKGRKSKASKSEGRVSKGDKKKGETCVTKSEGKDKQKGINQTRKPSLTKKKTPASKDLNDDASYKTSKTKTSSVPDSKEGVKRVLPSITPPKVIVPITDIKPLVIKINDHIALRIKDQSHIHIDFNYYPVHMSLYLGIKIFPEILERIDKITRDPADKREVPCYFEFLNKKTESLSVLYKKRLELKKAAKKREIKQMIKHAYIMGTYIYLKNKNTSDFKIGTTIM